MTRLTAIAARYSAEFARSKTDARDLVTIDPVCRYAELVRELVSAGYAATSYPDPTSEAARYVVIDEYALVRIQCHSCLAPAQPGRSRCHDCARLHREAAAARTLERRRQGRCVTCGREAVSGRTLCAKHLRWYRERSRS